VRLNFRGLLRERVQPLYPVLFPELLQEQLTNFQAMESTGIRPAIDL
jgi:hypothetical protein